MVMRVPESPRWLLLNRDDENAARRILFLIDPDAVDKTVQETRHAAREVTQDGLFVRAYAWPMLLAFLVAAFNQLSGINFIINFAPRIFELAGLDSSSALLSTAGIGIVNLGSTMIGLWLIDRSGRKMLLLIGSVGYIVSLAAVSWAFGTGAGGLPVVWFVSLFIAAHAVGQGAVIWVVIGSRCKRRALRYRLHDSHCGRLRWTLADIVKASDEDLEPFGLAKDPREAAGKPTNLWDRASSC